METNKTNKKVVNPKIQRSSSMLGDKIVMVHWNGRFGNRVFSYMFGKTYADRYGFDFYLPSHWEGTHLFVDSGVKIISDDTLRLEVNQSKKPMDSLDYRQGAINRYNQATGDSIKFFNPDMSGQQEHRNVFFDNLVNNQFQKFQFFFLG